MGPFLIKILIFLLQVKKLEILVASMKTSYEAKFEALNKALEIERKARLNAEDELQKLIKH